MRVRKKILFFTLIGVLILFTAQNASATLVEGVAEYDDGTIQAYIAYIVYENGTEFSDEWGVHGITSPGEEEDFVYAYYITNDSDSLDDIAWFAILGLDENNTTSGMECGDIGGLSDIEPCDSYLDTDESKGVWEWKDESPYSLIATDEHSWLLFFSSKEAYKMVGKEGYEIKGPQSSDEIPTPTPEPSIVALFGVGSAALLRRRKK